VKLTERVFPINKLFRYFCTFLYFYRWQIWKRTRDESRETTTWIETTTTSHQKSQ